MRDAVFHLMAALALSVAASLIKSKPNAPSRTLPYGKTKTVVGRSIFYREKATHADK